MELIFQNLTRPRGGVAACYIADDLKLSKILAEINKDSCITNAIKADKSFEGKKGQVLTVIAPHCTELDVLFIIGIGSKDKADEGLFMSVGGIIASRLNAMKISSSVVVAESIPGVKLEGNHIASNIALGMKLKNYSFNKYFVDKKDDHQLNIEKVNIFSENADESEAAFKSLSSVAGGTLLARDLVSEPANYLYPETFAERCMELKKLGVKLKALKKKEMEKLGMGSLLAVGQGSDKEPHLVVMEWKGGKAKEKPLAFVGKGVTFDTGGINLKPTGHIEDMKYDMGGAAVVTGLMHALAARKAKVNAIGVIGLVENMPSGTAQRPSDVVKSMSGQTIEVDNTDAEGRMVLADAMWYTVTKYKPEFIVDLATLTGAVVVALGDGYAGLFSNDDELAGRIFEAGEKTGEKVWRLPMGEYYDKQINSQIADVKNTGERGRGAGSITAAQFLKRFVKDSKWAHLDIAGVTWTKQGSYICPKGATGFGVRMLDKLVQEHYEVK